RREVRDALADAKEHPECHNRELHHGNPHCEVSDKALRALIEKPVTPAARDFQSWLLFDKNGILLGRSPVPRNNTTGLLYHWRDYFVGARDNKQPYVSRIFPSEGDSAYKVGVAFPVLDSDRVMIGLLLAQLPAGSSFGGFTLSDSPPPKGVVD